MLEPRPAVHLHLAMELEPLPWTRGNGVQATDVRLSWLAYEPRGCEMSAIQGGS